MVSNGPEILAQNRGQFQTTLPTQALGSLEVSPSQVIESFVQAFSNPEDPINQGVMLRAATQVILSDADKFSELLLKITKNFKGQKIATSQTRLIATSICKILGEYIASHQYEPGEEENLRIVIQLFGSLILGAIKTPVIPNRSTPELSTGFYRDAGFEDEDEQLGEDLIEQGDSPRPMRTETKTLPKESSNYSLIALSTINYLFYNKRINPEDWLEISNLYGKSWKEAEIESIRRYEQFINSTIASELKLSMEVRDGLFAIKKLGLRDVIGLAEAQYRKRQYIESKNRLNLPGYDGSNADETYLDKSPLEMIAESLLTLYIKMKDSQQSPALAPSNQINLSEDLPSYLMLKTGYTYEEQLSILFNTIAAMYIDGLLRNVQTKAFLEKDGQFGKNAQVMFEQINQTWKRDLTQLARMCVNTQTITAYNGQKIKKSLLDYPLKSLFTEYEKRGSLSQTINQEKVNELPIQQCANLILLMYCSIQGVQNPLGQIKHLYYSLWERVTLNPENKQFVINFLYERGFDKSEIRMVLESNEIILMMQWGDKPNPDGDGH